MASSIDSRRAKPRFKMVGRKDGLVDRVVQEIADQILRGRLPVGARLPGEREFCEQLGVSRPVVREAVRILTTQGMLETRHGIGTTVRAVGREEVVKPLKMLLRIRGENISVEHLHQVRSILEVENAGLAAEYGTEDDLQALTRIYGEMQESGGDPARFAVTDSEFHRRLGEATHNPLLIVLLDSVHGMMAEVRTLIANESGLYGRVMPTHLQILNSIMARDAATARSAMREHLEIARTIQIEALGKQKTAHDMG